MSRILIAAGLLTFLASPAEDSKDFILAARRSGVVEFIDPATLMTVGRIHLNFPGENVGLNGVYMSADGSTLYVEGPTPDDPKLCCSLFAIDMATLELKEVAGIPGTRSRKPFLISNGLVYSAGTLPAREAIEDMNGDHLHLSPDGHWLFGVNGFPDPVLDIYDFSQGKKIRRLASTHLEGEWFPTGAWAGDNFYLYSAKTDGSAARLWTVQPDSAQMGEGLPVQPHAQVRGCSQPILEEIVATGASLFVYEWFGYKLDRRRQCHSQVPGGAWRLDPATGQLRDHIAPELHFSKLVPDRARPQLYGLATDDPDWLGRVELVRIDASEGRVQQLRVLEKDHWWIATAQVRHAPSGDVRANPQSR